MKWNVSRQLVSKIGKGHIELYERSDGRVGFRVNCCLTFKCNLDCNYCSNKYFDGTTPRSNEMGLSEWIKVIEDFQLPIMHIYISGGEPTLHPDFSEIVNYFLVRGYSITINTNLTNNKIAELIKGDKTHLCIMATRHVGQSETIFKDRLKELEDYPIRALEFEQEQIFDFSKSLKVAKKDICLNDTKLSIGPDGKVFTVKKELLENYCNHK